MASPPINIPTINKLRIIYMTDDEILSDDDYSTADEDDSDIDSVSFGSIQASPRIELPRLMVYILDAPFEMPESHQHFFRKLARCKLGIVSVLVVSNRAPISVRNRYPFFTDYCFASDTELHVRYAIERHGGPLIVIGTFDIYKLFTLRGAINSPQCCDITTDKFNSILQDVDSRISELSRMDRLAYDPSMSDVDFEVLHSCEEDRPIKLFFDSLYSTSGFIKPCYF